MNLKGQHTGNFLIFFAGLIIMAYAVVPHHHHFELTHSSEQESTLSEYFKYYLAGIIVNIEVPPIKNLAAIILGHRPILLKQFFFTAQTLRAPPVSA